MPTAEGAMISEEATRRELWISFASLVRAYLAAAQIGQEPLRAFVEQQEAYALELVSAVRSIRITLEPGGASGYWALYQTPQNGDDALLADGAFRIGLDSLVEWTGLPGRQEMDAVAEALATLVLEESL